MYLTCHLEKYTVYMSEYSNVDSYYIIRESALSEKINLSDDTVWHQVISRISLYRDGTIKRFSS